MATGERGTALVGGAFLISRRAALEKDSQMPKMKTKASAKKRFKVTATGKVMVQQAGKRHGMIKRSNDFIRKARGMTVLSDPDAKIVKRFMPYHRGK
jgi:large subunit ribosomal protein L35